MGLASLSYGPHVFNPEGHTYEEYLRARDILGRC